MLRSTTSTPPPTAHTYHHSSTIPLASSFSKPSLNRHDHDPCCQSITPSNRHSCINKQTQRTHHPVFPHHLRPSGQCPTLEKRKTTLEEKKKNKLQ
ncbi:unnamed protein product [Periconia digitata]|uniref:Uncharacterized protein n=1 Tax=Periconia digitata TaxID=1303443 RepID=A0A9W4U6H2_9PLEO|nr:unnamed protein product [Periconia digitata]